MLKILRVIPSMNPSYGGPCQGIRNCVPELLNLGVETEVACLDAPDSEYLGQDNFLIFALGPAQTAYSYTKKLDSWLLKHISEYDGIIIHGLWQYSSYGTFYIWRKLKKRRVNVPKLYLMPHGMLDPYFQQAPERRLKALRNLIFWEAFEKHVINGVDGVLFTCEQELLLARTTFQGYHPRAEENVGYGIQQPPEQADSQLKAFLGQCPEAIGKSYWLFLSRVHQKKGLDLLIKAYRIHYEQNEDIPVLIIAGPGMDTSYGAHLKKLADGLPVYFTGMLQGDAKWGALYGAQTFILPSHQENFGIAVVEALACGTPVLISEQVNIWREIIEVGAGLAEADTVEGTTKLLQSWLNLSEEQQMSKQKKAFKAYQQYFTTGAFGENLKALFNY